MLLRITAFLIAVLIGQHALAETKAALLIGNANYTGSATRLKNPPNDVAALKAMLEQAGFDVLTVENVSRAAMAEALVEFEEKVSGTDIGLIYYSGHGIEVDGKNYLIPVDAKLASERSVKYETIILADLLHALNGAAKLKLVLLDACRDNPFLATMKRAPTRGVLTKGLARIDTSDSNMLIGYATAPGAVALDGVDDISPYAAALARHLTAPGLEIEAALKAVTRDVYEATAKQQRPYIMGSLVESIRLGPADESLSSSSAPDPCRDASAHWSAVGSRKNKVLLEEHLRRFNECAFASLAKLELEALSEINENSNIGEPRLILYEEHVGKAEPVALDGTVEWVSREEASASGGVTEKVVQATVNVKDKGLKALITFRRNTDTTLPASHIVEFVFSLPRDFQDSGIENVQRVAMKSTEQDRGDALVGVPAKLTDDFHIIALNNYAEAISKNTELLRTRDWIDIPITYRSGKRAILTLKKGRKGMAAFDTAFQSWSKEFKPLVDPHIVATTRSNMVENDEGSSLTRDNEPVVNTENGGFIAELFGGGNEDDNSIGSQLEKLGNVPIPARRPE